MDETAVLIQAEHLARPVPRRRVLTGASVLALSAFSLPGCSPQQAGSSAANQPAGAPQRGGTLTFAANASTAKEKLDPQKANGPSGYLRNVSVFDTLVAVTADGWKIQPRLALSWEPSADLRSWRFTLRKGVTFHDGRPLEAKDVVWTFRRVLDKNVGSGAFARFSRTMTPEGITAPDPSTILITLTSPDSLLPYAFADPATVIVKEGQGTFGPESSIGTGPYKLVSWTPGQSLEMERNPQYWDGQLPYLDGLRRVDATDEATASQGVLSGNFDVAEAVSYAAAEQLGRSPNAQLIRLRDTTSLVAVMDVMMAPSDSYYPDGLPRTTYDPDQAKSLLAAADFPGGVDVDLWAYGTYSPLALAYADTAKPAGIRAHVQQGNPDTFWDVVYLHDKFYASDWQQFFPGDLLWYAFGSDSVANESKLNFPAIDELYTKALKTTDTEQQKAFIKQGLALAAQNMGLIIPVMADQLLLAKKNVQGVTSAPFTRYDLRHASLSA